MNFTDPKTDQDGKPWAVVKFNKIIQERYFISKNINTPYTEVGKMTPTEREKVIELIVEEIKINEKQLNHIAKNKK